MEPAVRISKEFVRAWQIYDDHRTALFNTRYFETKLARIQSGTLYLDIIIAVGTSTTGIAGWALWSRPNLSVLWATLAGVAASLAVVKPILRLDDKLVKLTRTYGEYGRVAAAYNHLVGDIAIRQNVDDDILKRYEELRKAESAIELVPQRSKRLRQNSQSEINREWPISKYWSPPKFGA